MAEYIEREALLLRIDCYGTNKFGMLDEDIRAFVKAQPAADVAPVVHARWIPFHSETAGDIQYCSNCKIGNAAKSDFCPHCGAMMDGGVTDVAD